jgi:protein NirF
MNRRAFLAAAPAAALAAPALRAAEPCAPRIVSTGALGVVVERASGSVLIVDWLARAAIGRVAGLGDLSHASLVFSPDQRFAFVFGRDGGLTKVDLATLAIAARVVQAGNSIGGAISDDGRLVAVANYEPGGVRVFDADTLAPVADLPAGSKVIGLVDAPGRRFVFSLWDAGEARIADFSRPGAPVVTRIEGVGANPYDALIAADGRTYVVGLFGEDGLTTLDLWDASPTPRRILAGYGRGEQPLPVYKMPHLEGWAQAGDRFALPAVGRHELLWVDARGFAEVGRTAVHGQPVFAVARPGGRQVWVNFAHPLNDAVQVVDAPSGEVVATLKPGPAVLHMEFTPRGREAWVSVRDANQVVVIDADSLATLAAIPAEAPSGIFFTARAHQSGL